jgi:hypothetical protein
VVAKNSPFPLFSQPHCSICGNKMGGSHGPKAAGVKLHWAWLACGWLTTGPVQYSVTLKLEAEHTYETSDSLTTRRCRNPILFDQQSLLNMKIYINNFLQYHILVYRHEHNASFCILKWQLNFLLTEPFTSLSVLLSLHVFHPQWEQFVTDAYSTKSQHLTYDRTISVHGVLVVIFFKPR